MLNEIKLNTIKNKNSSNASSNNSNFESVKNKNYTDTINKLKIDDIIEHYESDLTLNSSTSEIKFQNNKENGRRNVKTQESLSDFELQDESKVKSIKRRSQLNEDEIKIVTSKDIPLTSIDQSPNDVQQSKPKLRKWMQTDQSRKLPNFMLALIKFLTGIPDNNIQEKPKKLNPRAITSTTFYLITICFGFLFAFSNIWYSIVDGEDKSTKATLFSESTTILLSIVWFILGIYSINVLFNLYITKDLEDTIRFRTKSYFKLPSGIILIFLIGGFCYAKFSTIKLDENYCNQIDLDLIICYLRYYSSVIYFLICLFWNYLVSLTIMFINRSTTIYIRRFIFEMEEDSLNIMKIANSITNNNKPIILFDGLSKHEDSELNESYFDYNDDADNIVKNANIQHMKLKQSQQTASSYVVKGSTKTNNNSNEELSKQDQIDCTVCLKRFASKSSQNIEFYCEHVKSPNQIFQKYWRLAYILRLISQLTQRWTFSLLITAFIWCISLIIKWIKNKEPTLADIGQFLLPLLIVAVILGTFAEANAESYKLIQAIHPLEERIRTLNYIKNNPLQLRVYGFAVDYGAEIKFIGAFAVAFISQVAFHEFNNNT